MPNYPEGSVEAKLTNTLYWLEHAVAGEDRADLTLSEEDAQELYNLLYDALDLIDDLKSEHPRYSK